MLVGVNNSTSLQGFTFTFSCENKINKEKGRYCNWHNHIFFILVVFFFLSKKNKVRETQKIKWLNKLDIFCSVHTSLYCKLHQQSSWCVMARKTDMLLHHRTICNGSAVWGLYVVQHGQWFMSNNVSVSPPVTSGKRHIECMFYFPLLAFSLKDMTAIYGPSIFDLNIKMPQYRI